MEILVSRKVNPFHSPKTSLGKLDSEVVSKIITAAADVALIVDKDGIIKDVAVGGENLAGAGIESWLGVPWAETVTVDSKHKVEEMIRDAALQQPLRWREVNHPGLQGQDVPIRYSALQVKSDGRLVALGRDLRGIAALQQRLLDAQMAIERDYARVRQTELRYRLLFQLSSEAIIIADAATGRVIEINPAASELLGEPSKKLVSTALLEHFDAGDAMALQDMLAAVRATGKSEDLIVRLPSGHEKLLLSASSFRQDASIYVLMRLNPTQRRHPADDVLRGNDSLRKVMDGLPDGFVVTDLDGRILSVNTAFLDLAQLPNQDRAVGQPLDNWLGRSGVDLNVLSANLREHGAVRNFQTTVHGAYGSSEDVEVSAVGVMTGERPCFGFVIRASTTRNATKGRGNGIARSVEQLTELVGRVSLKDLVRESSDMIEKLCIEAALELTGDNRASAAEMLGLSRQSLYVKLRRYGLGDLGTEHTE
jgi:transcriptional regulator PpsR